MFVWQCASAVPPMGYFLDAPPSPRNLTYRVSEVLDRPGPQLRNLAHVPAFALFSWLWAWSLARRYSLARRLFAAALATASFAIVNEMSQLLVPLRYVSLGDVASNLFGVALGLTGYGLLAAAASSSGSAAHAAGG